MASILGDIAETASALAAGFKVTLKNLFRPTIIRRIKV